MQVQSILEEGKGEKLVKTPTQSHCKQRNLFCNVPMLSVSYAHHGTMSAGAQHGPSGPDQPYVATCPTLSSCRCHQWLGPLPQDMAWLPPQRLLTVVLDASSPHCHAFLLWKESKLV